MVRLLIRGIGVNSGCKTFLIFFDVREGEYIRAAMKKRPPKQRWMTVLAVIALVIFFISLK
jgi:hypothetical protein